MISVQVSVFTKIKVPVENRFQDFRRVPIRKSVLFGTVLVLAYMSISAKKSWYLDLIY